MYIVKRLMSAIPVFFGITLIVFFMMSMAPANIADLAGGEQTASGTAERAALEATLHLDDPIWVRYLNWLADLLRGDLGVSYRTGQAVTAAIEQRVMPSLILSGSGVLLAIFIGIPLGVMAATKPQTHWDHVAGAISLFSFGTPSFFLSLIGIYIFSLQLDWLPASGMYSFGIGGSLGDLLIHLILPASIICIGSLGNLIRQTRSACLEVFSEDYIRTARAKGLREFQVIWLHGFRNALIPVLTTILNHIPHVVGGSMIVERIFGWPGMGSLLFSSVNNRDYPVIMGIAMMIALAVLATGILLEIVYRFADPQIRR
ncbi:MAG: ABC transporter permease [Evtepia sp.]